MVLSELTKYHWAIVALVIAASIALVAICLWPRKKRERVHHYDDPLQAAHSDESLHEHIEPPRAWPRPQPVFAPVPSPAAVDEFVATSRGNLPPKRRLSKKRATAIKKAVKKVAARKK